MANQFGAILRIGGDVCQFASFIGRAKALLFALNMQCGAESDNGRIAIDNG
jgi:hypothetical protein